MMLTGTPLDLTPFGPLLSVLGFAYWLLALVLVVVALRVPKHWLVKLVMAAAVFAAFIYPVARHVGSETQQHNEAQARLAEAMALFAERCKTAGEKISRTAADVDGVVWMKWREEYSNRDNFADQWKLNDPYGRDCGLEDCIANLLRVTEGSALNPEGAQRYIGGYRYVETVDPADGRRYRYTAAMKQYWNPEAVERHRVKTGGGPPAYSFQFRVERVPIEAFSARYGVTWDDISTREDRERWIAGSSLKVIDLQTNAVLAERMGYMIDRGQGSQAGFRSPWLEAVLSACPSFPGQGPSNPRPKRDYVQTETSKFAVRVLKPTSGD